MNTPLPPQKPPSRRSAYSARRVGFTPLFAAGLAFLLILATGCSRFHHEQHQYVYVAARQVYLHDRVAAVSNRVGLVTNGEALEIVERGKRFVKVKTPKGEIGWLEDHAIIDDKLYAQFQDLAKKHEHDPVVANGQLRDDLYLHVQPGRETAHFLLIPGNAKVQMLVRGSVEKAAAPGTPVAPKPKAPAASAATPPSSKTPSGNSAVPPAAPQPVSAPAPPPSMEDWWLVRDAQNHTGWLLASRLDVDVPDEVAQYAEGQRMVAAYPIAKVEDDGTGREHKAARKEAHNGKTGKPLPVTQDDAPPSAPSIKQEYVTVLEPPKGGLPFDFDQIRVFTWSLNHHRYETGYRLHGVQGYLPVTIGQETVSGQSYPTFTFQIASGPDVVVDQETGVTRPAHPRTLSFRLEGNLVKRTGADQGPIILSHDLEGEPGKSNGKAKKKHVGK